MFYKPLSWCASTLKGTGSSLMVEPRNVATTLIRFSQLSTLTHCNSNTHKHARKHANSFNKPTLGSQTLRQIFFKTIDKLPDQQNHSIRACWYYLQHNTILSCTHLALNSLCSFLAASHHGWISLSGFQQQLWLEIKGVGDLLGGLARQGRLTGLVSANCTPQSQEVPLQKFD